MLSACVSQILTREMGHIPGGQVIQLDIYKSCNDPLEK
jgi:hypothetical protein